jgi:hypothetical protein
MTQEIGECCCPPGRSLRAVGAVRARGQLCGAAVGCCCSWVRRVRGGRYSRRRHALVVVWYSLLRGVECWGAGVVVSCCLPMLGAA